MDVAALPSLPYEGNLLHLTIHRDLTDDDPDLEWCCDMISKLCPHSRGGHYDDLTFLGTLLTSEGIETLIRKLHERNVRAGNPWNMFSAPHGQPGTTQDLAASLSLSGLYIF